MGLREQHFRHVIWPVYKISGCWNYSRRAQPSAPWPGGAVGDGRGSEGGGLCMHIADHFVVQQKLT